MALYCLHAAYEGCSFYQESGEVQPGDVVFSWEGARGTYAIHAGIYIGLYPQTIHPGGALQVYGIPGDRRARGETDPARGAGGSSLWGGLPEYSVSLVGRCEALEAEQRDDIVLDIQCLQLEVSPVAPPIQWDHSLFIDKSKALQGRPGRFIKGTCAHFVEWLYERAGQRLVAPGLGPSTPIHPGWIYPASQIRALYIGVYPIEGPWDPRYELYPDCLFAPPARAKGLAPPRLAEVADAGVAPACIGPA